VPTYEYQCEACRAQYELRQGFDAESTHVCEQCGRGVARRVLHAPRVLFKGTGFYVTDSRKGSSAVSDSRPDTAASEPAAESAAPSAAASAADAGSAAAAAG
jgi:putative FmdB family regulatory protein